MAYNIHERLRHNGLRFRAINAVTVSYSRGVVAVNVVASPVLREAQEIVPGVALTRIEYQDWGADVVELGVLYPPKNGDKITLTNGEIFQVISLTDEEPAFVHTTAERTRVLIHSQRVKR